jgi:hypothetical protein
LPQVFQVAQGSDRPDVIIATIPTIDTAEVAVRFGKEQKLPVLVDIRMNAG